MKASNITLLNAFIFCAISTLVSSCKKDDLREPVRSNAKVQFMPFVPNSIDIQQLVETHMNSINTYIVGSKSSVEKPLMEALWLNEAALNYTVGDANISSDLWKEEKILIFNISQC